MSGFTKETLVELISAIKEEEAKILAGEAKRRTWKGHGLSQEEAAEVLAELEAELRDLEVEEMLSTQELMGEDYFGEPSPE